MQCNWHLPTLPKLLSALFPTLQTRLQKSFTPAPSLPHLFEHSAIVNSSSVQQCNRRDPVLLLFAGCSHRCFHFELLLKAVFWKTPDFILFQFFCTFLIPKTGEGCTCQCLGAGTRFSAGNFQSPHQTFCHASPTRLPDQTSFYGPIQILCFVTWCILSAGIKGISP